MNYEEVKNEFIKLKKEELAYIDQISKISKNKILSEYEKIEIYPNVPVISLITFQEKNIKFKKRL